jgi:hypothetical protein|tara:strand:+ start:232 stop:423 length:192 start_codon:yes stop_codon:yes gene_type:complete
VLIKGKYMSYILVSDECDTIEVVGEDRYGDVYETREQAIQDMKESEEMEYLEDMVDIHYIENN